MQTPTLALIVARDLLIANFVPQKFWEAHGTFGGLEAKAELDAYAAAPERIKLLGAPSVSSERDKKVFWDKPKAEAFVGSAQAPATYRATEKKNHAQRETASAFRPTGNAETDVEKNSASPPPTRSRFSKNSTTPS